ncbi:hypothetical protein ACFPIF_09955 [Brevundimonas faecalis]|uniref:VpaChn25_0724 family phage protein n=1 Tax=Brevundimonas faecalis TaxID=947378 RepID=UPI0036151A30
MSYRDLVAADRRLCILRLLVEDGGHGNESTLEQGLEALGHRAGMERAVVRQYLRDLEQVGCITVEFYRDKIMVAAITERGVKVARGQVTVDGVKQPSPGA